MELWDIYDRDKQRTGRTMKRNDWHMQPGDFHLTVLGVIRHTNGKYLITKRVMTKAWAPGSWEVSGGAAQAGEDSLDAVKREIKEETGLDVSLHCYWKYYYYCQSFLLDFLPSYSSQLRSSCLQIHLSRTFQMYGFPQIMSLDNPK